MVAINVVSAIVILTVVIGYLCTLMSARKTQAVRKTVAVVIGLSSLYVITHLAVSLTKGAV